MNTVCELYPHSCRIPEGKCRFCGVRTCRNGRIISTACGKISSVALDLTGKKPLRYFHPGSQVMSTGSMSCNICCPFRQNYEISMQESTIFCVRLQPQKLADIALQQKRKGDIGIAYTYNELLIGFKFVLACCKPARQHGLKSIIVTSGCIQEQKLLELLPHVDTMNIDVKAFDEEGYHRLQGDFTAVRRSVELTVQHTHAEIISLTVPGLHDDADRIEEGAA